MATAQGSIESTVIDLAAEALSAFADDISTMFEVEIECEQTDVGVRQASDVQRRYKKVSTFHTVLGEGALHGTFMVGFDCGGLFTLGGVIVMLPPNRIKESAKRGTLSDAEAMKDAVGEVGNLLIGAWDRVFREELEGHKHFRKENTFIGDPWNETDKTLGLAPTEEFHYIEYKMKVGDFMPFTCGVIFPMSTLAGGGEDAKPPDPEPEAEATEAASETEADPAPAPEPAAESKPEPSPPASEESVAEPPAAEAAAEETEEPEAAPAPQSEPEPAAPAPAPETPSPAPQSQADTQPEEVDEKTAAPRDIPPPPSASPRPVVIASNEGLAGILSLPVRDIMDTRVVWGSPGESVQDLLSKMQQHDVGYAMIGEEGVLDGIVSKSNILGAISPYLRPVFAKWHTPADDATLNIKIQWVMSRPVRTVSPDAPLSVAIQSMQQFGGRCLPAVDERGTVQGVLTVFDIFRIFTQNEQFGSSGRTPQAPCLMI